MDGEVAVELLGRGFGCFCFLGWVGFDLGPEIVAGIVFIWPALAKKARSISVFLRAKRARKGKNSRKSKRQEAKNTPLKNSQNKNNISPHYFPSLCFPVFFPPKTNKKRSPTARYDVIGEDPAQFRCILDWAFAWELSRFKPPDLKHRGFFLPHEPFLA